MAVVNKIHYQQLLDTLREKHGVVGASLAVLHDDQVHLAASGLLNLETEVQATTDSLFQIGSITKVFTATLIMQLLDEGRLELDRPAKSYLPAFQLADDEAARSITIRQLLCHTSGMAGDFFPEDDPFGPSIFGFVERCHLLPQTHPVGKNFSYSNSAYTLAGRLVEVLTGLPWKLAIAERILRPLGLQQSVADPADVLRYRAAMGHLPDPQDSKVQQLAPQCYLPLSHAPAGTVLSMSASDLLAFAKMHMNGGRGRDGKTLLSEASVTQMQQAQVSLPAHSPRRVTHWGLGWFLCKQQSLRILGHDGATLGQFAYLRMLPKHGLAIALLTNSSSRELFVQIEKELLAELAGVELTADPEPGDPPVDLQHYIGRYESMGSAVTVSAQDRELVSETEHKLAAIVNTRDILQAIDKDCFVTILDQGRPAQNIRFIGSDKKGAAQYLFSEFRLLRRVGDQDK